MTGATELCAVVWAKVSQASFWNAPVEEEFFRSNLSFPIGFKTGRDLLVENTTRR